MRGDQRFLLRSATSSPRIARSRRLKMRLRSIFLQTNVAFAPPTDQASSLNKKQRSPELVRVLSKTIRLRDPEHRKFVAQ